MEIYCTAFLKIFLSIFPPTYDIIVIESKIKTWNEWFGKKNERRRITCDHKFENVETGFEHYSYEMSEFKPNKPNTINL